jgi:ABC-type transport system involved in cytochrome c biogenesis permease subunit
MIAFSITVCGLAPGLSERETVGSIMLLVIIAGAVSCLVLYGILLRALFRPPQELGKQ